MAHHRNGHDGLRFALSERSTAAHTVHEVERFLLGDPAAAPDLDTLRALSLSGHAFVTLPEHPQRDLLRQLYSFTAARHLAVRQGIIALLRAWAAADVRAVVFKGFYLAEFVYPSAGQRTYADVDIVIEEGRAGDALALAQPLGWQVVWRVDVGDDVLAVHGAEYTGHEVGQIRHPALDLAIDVHRRAVHNNHNRLPAHPAGQRLTAALRDGADEIEWEGVTVRVPNPLDAVVFGLALNRCWGSDAWQVKPRDYADFEALIARFDVTPSAVLERARRLGVGRTVATYLRRCDPTVRRLDLRTPSWWALRWWNLRAASERGWRDGASAWMALVDAVTDGVALLRMLPVVRRAERDVAAGEWRQRETAGAADDSGPRLTNQHWRTSRRAIERVIKLRRTRAEVFASVAALAGHEVMRRHGLPARIERVAGHQGGVERAQLWLGERVVRFASDALHAEAPRAAVVDARSTVRTGRSAEGLDAQHE